MHKAIRNEYKQVIITETNCLVDLLRRYAKEKDEAGMEFVFSKAQTHLLPCIHTGYIKKDVTIKHFCKRVVRL